MVHASRGHTNTRDAHERIQKVLDPQDIFRNLALTCCCTGYESRDLAGCTEWVVRRIDPQGYGVERSLFSVR